MSVTGKTSDIELKISSNWNAFTKAEKKVASRVMEQFDQVIYHSITDLAEEAGVGETTVLRFCRKLGFKGYHEFKLAVAADQVNSVASLHEDIDENDELQVMVQKITMANQKALQDTMALIDRDQLAKAIDMMLQARKVHFYGVGTSGITAQDALNRFLRIGFPAEAFTDSHLQAMAAATLTSEDVAVGITVSGSTKDTVDVLRIARESGARTVAITHFARSPVSQIADVVLLTGGRESPLQGGSLAAKIAQLHVIDLLFTGIAIRSKERALYYKEKTAKAVVDKIY
ncbi:transcriptional regulator, RpiR family [Planifilum fulgidum]|uniref:Transcriptional regulator, RpiR family n=1 Tax=Planifilum fulgidum TaxID=201973 RepID=A0A1I2SJF7_9BACL|nr:MurR/RpiR family transcriptional regulator [Planifilum fulgidum]SFG50366.1 transcriptional regulator, RpiR family [Planifilum fulgidum]